VKNADGSHAVMQRSKTQTSVWFEYVVLLMGEAIDNHDARVVRVGGACRVDDVVGSWWNADMIRSVTPTIINGDEPWERWLLFDDSSFALGFGCLACARGCELAGLHELANVSAGR